MKHFRLCNNDLTTNWYEHSFINASDIIYQIEKNGFETFEIDWKTPVTGEYATLIQVEDNKIMFINDNFKLPKKMLVSAQARKKIKSITIKYIITQPPIYD